MKILHNDVKKEYNKLKKKALKKVDKNSVLSFLGEAKKRAVNAGKALTASS